MVPGKNQNKTRNQAAKQVYIEKARTYSIILIQFKRCQEAVLNDYCIPTNNTH